MAETPVERIIQEYVPGKQVTLAHLIPNPNKEILMKLGLPEDSNAIGILTITPSEAAIIAADVAKKSGNISIGFIDRFSGALVITGEISSVEYAIKQVTNSLLGVLGFAVPDKITRT